MSLLSAPLPPTPAQNPSHPFSYHHLLPLTSLATLIAIIHPGTPTCYLINRITQTAKTQKFGQKDASLMHGQYSHFNVPQESYFTKICK